MRINIALTYAAFVPLRQERIRNSGVLQRPLLADCRLLRPSAPDRGSSPSPSGLRDSTPWQEEAVSLPSSAKE